MKEQIDEMEVWFRLGDIELEIRNIDNQIDKFRLERQKLEWEFRQLKIMHDSFENSESDPSQEETIEKIEKPKKLKKTNDKLSENHTEVQQ